MNVSLYRNLINKKSKKFQKMQDKSKKLLIIFSIIWIIIFSLFTILFKYYLGIMFFCIFLSLVFSGYVVLAIIYFVKKNKFIYDDFSELVYEIISNEVSIDRIEKDDRSEYIRIVKDSRFALPTDNVDISSAVTIYNGNLKFDLITCTVNRSTGKSSVQILNGIIINLNILTNRDLQIRTNKFYFKSSFISKQNQGESFYVIYPKGTIDQKISQDVKNQYESLKRTFNCEKCGINYDSKIKLYLEQKIKFRSIKKVDEEIVSFYCEMYKNYIEKIIEFSKELEDEYII